MMTVIERWSSIQRSKFTCALTASLRAGSSVPVSRIGQIFQHLTHSAQAQLLSTSTSSCAHDVPPLTPRHNRYEVANMLQALDCHKSQSLFTDRPSTYLWSRSSLILSRSASSPTSRFFLKLSIPSLSSRTECRKSDMINGLNAFN